MKLVGFENIPDKGPLIIIANHPSAFMDPVLIAANIKQPVHFVAAGEYIGKGIKAYIFKKFLHLIPVYRPSTRPEDVHKNKDMFKACFEHLKKGGTIMIFPEGVSITEKKIKPFKTGVARIAIGAELANQQNLNLKIAIVGINYESPHLFRSDVLVNAHDPVKVNNYILTQDANNFEQIDKLTKHLENIMQKIALHLPNDNDEELFEKLNLIYARDLKGIYDIDFKHQEKEFEMQQKMVDAINYFKNTEPQNYHDVSVKIDAYMRVLNESGLNDKDIKEIQFQKKFKRYTSYILGFPFFLIGFLANILPYKFVSFVLNKIKFNETFQGSLIVAFGLFSYTLYYTIITILLIVLTPIHWWALIFPILAYVNGVYALLYVDAIHYSRKRKNLRYKLKTDKKAVEELIKQRNNLIQELEKFRLAFEQKNGVN